MRHDTGDAVCRSSRNRNGGRRAAIDWYYFVTSSDQNQSVQVGVAVTGTFIHKNSSAVE